MLTRAQPADWPDAGILKGDLEAVAWCAPAEAERVAAALLADDKVIAVRVEAEPIEVD